MDGKPFHPHLRRYGGCSLSQALIIGGLKPAKQSIQLVRRNECRALRYDSFYCNCVRALYKYIKIGALAIVGVLRLITVAKSIRRVSWHLVAGEDKNKPLR